ncbi:NRAP protein, partial [Atractosteus spatula]|nr:NRAP protein [Atractosteus spatula]
WHKACFHCEICKMILTTNNFVSHQKKPYCQVHNPKNNTFTSVYETPINLNAKKQSEAVSEVSDIEKKRKDSKVLWVIFSTVMIYSNIYQECSISR